MYINDICNASTSLKFILFADDTNVFCSGVDIQTLCEHISCELDKLHVCLSVYKRSLNVCKTIFFLFGNRKNIDNVCCISINNSIITCTRVRATKFLRKLTWKDHITLVRSKAPVTPGLRPGYDVAATKTIWNRSKDVRLVAEVVGDRKGQMGRNKVDGHVQNLYPAIPNRLVPRMIFRFNKIAIQYDRTIGRR